MATARVQHIINGVSGLATDRYINSFYFVGPVVTPTTAAALASNVITFYTTPTATTFSVRSWLFAPSFADEWHTVKVYDMADATPRQPVYEFTPIALSPQGGDPLPSEVACCLSYRKKAVSGQVQRRMRGRIYIGPLTASSIDNSAPVTGARPKEEMLETFRLAGARLQSDSIADSYTWVVYSPTSGSDVSFEIDEVSTDDAFDTQRRRGLDPTQRTTLALT